MRLGDALKEAAGILAESGVAEPRREARLLAAYVLGVEPTQWLDADSQIDGTGFRAVVGRRAAREPLAFIVGRRGFWSLDLAASPATLIPRADSEALIEAALAALPDQAGVRRVLDLGTGTGCLLLAALSDFAHAFGVGVDISPAASALAAANARRCGLGHRAAFLAGDWGAGLAGGFDLVLCNPPYIESAAIAGLMPEVALHEPRRALDGGTNGLDDYARLMPQVRRLLAPAGVAIFELGAGQEGAVLGLATRAGLIHIATRPDLGGVARALVLRAEPA